MEKQKVFYSLVLAVVLSLVLIPGCVSGGAADSGGWRWPDQIVFSSAGSSGLAKYVSWASLLEKDIKSKVRVVPEENSIQRFRSVQEQRALLTNGGKRETGNVIEAVEGHAVKDAGPFPMRFVWTHALANSGIFVRGDSPIKTIYDIKPGIRWAVWSMQPTVVKVPKAIADWIKLPHDQIVWVNAGSYDGCARAVAEGRADIMFCFPVSAAIYEAASAPQGIRFLDLNSDKDPEGAKRFRLVDPSYCFGPILSGVPEARGHWGTVGYTSEVTHAASDPELIYHLVQWLDSNFERYKKSFDSNEFMDIANVIECLKTTCLPVHEGTIRFLKERGLWTPDHDRRQATNLAMIDAYIKAYPEVIKLAESKGIKIDPTNKAWIDLWEGYKREKHLPRFGLHQSLTVEYGEYY